MALSLGKIGILVGAGIVGSVLAKEGRLPGMTDFFSDALKIALKPLKQGDSAPLAGKPKSEALMAQISTLRQELQAISGGRSITIVTSGSRGGQRYGVIILVVVAGYGYIWWKGWKLPDLSFATKRGLADASNAIAKQIDQLYSSLSTTRRDLTRKLTQVDSTLDNCTQEVASTRQEATELRGDVTTFDESFQDVRSVIETLGNKVGRLEKTEDVTLMKVMGLVSEARKQAAINEGRKLELEGCAHAGLIQASSSNVTRPALEQPHMTPSSRAGSMSPGLSLELPSPSGSKGNDEVQQPLNSTTSASGLKELEGVGAVGTPRIANGIGPSEVANGTTSSTFSWRKYMGSGAILSRTRSATQAYK